MLSILPSRYYVRALATVILLIGLLGAVFAQGTKSAPVAGGTATAPPPPGTSLRDPLQGNNDIRTLPLMPQVGAWSLVLGNPSISGEGVGIVIDKPGQAIIYPTTGLLTPQVGTIEFSVTPSIATDPNNLKSRVLLDSWAANGSARWRLILQGTKLTLSMTNDRNQTKSLDVNVNWPVKGMRRVDILWDVASLALLIDGNNQGKIDQPALPGREPLGIVLGNSTDYQSPSMCTISNLRLSLSRDYPPAPSQTSNETLPPEELLMLKAQGNDRRLFPMFERLRQQNVLEIPFAYALAYSDLGDIDRAMQSVTPITNNPNSPLYVRAITLRADLLAMQSDFVSAYEQLQVLTTNPDQTIRVGAQVKQAQILYNSGQKSEAMRLIGEIIAGNPNIGAINNAYLLVAIELYTKGDYDGCKNALNSIVNNSAPPRETVPIGVPFPIKVSDPTLAVRTSDVGLLVTAKATSGDSKQFTLKPAFSRGMYIGDMETALGKPDPTDTQTLHVRGKDRITISYHDRLANTDCVYSVGLATDAKLLAIAEAGVDITREVEGYQKKNILDENWNLIGQLPKTASAFFRDPMDGSLLRKGHRFDKNYFSNVKAGQGIYIELNDPDRAISDQKDTATVDISTQSGTGKQVTLTETAPYSGIFTTVLKTTPLDQPKEGMLAVGINDTITVKYADPDPAANSKDPLPIAKVMIRTYDGKITVAREIPDPTEEDPGHTVAMYAYRINADPDAKDSTVVVTVDDRDYDISDAADKVTVKVKTESGTELPVALTETGPHTGIFTGRMRLSTGEAGGETPVLKVKAGEKIFTSYTDEENATGKALDRTFIFRANIAENATVKFFRQIIEKPAKPTTGVTPPANAFAPVVPPKISWEETTILVPNTVYRVDVTDGDVQSPGLREFYSKITLKSADGAFVDVPVRCSVGSFSTDKMGTVTERPTIFSGDLFVRLGDKDSPTHAYYSQVGDSNVSSMSIIDVKDEETVANTLWSMPAINVQGRDQLTATYLEPLTADNKKDVPQTVKLHVAGDAAISLLNMKGNPLETMKPGMPFELQIEDPKGDLTTKRDTIKATVTTTANEKLDVELTETDVHSGIFSALIQTVYGTKPADNPDHKNIIAVPFGGKITIAYHDEETVVGTPADRTYELATAGTSDSDGSLLSKVFDDPKFEVETLVRLGESLYAVGAAELATNKPKPGEPHTNDKLQESARLLQTVINRFPTSEFVVESLFLTGKIRGSEQKYDEAVKLFNRVIDEYPDCDFVPQALFQLVMLYYDQENIEKATEAAMHLVYGFPKNPTVADAVLRIAEYYYQKKKDYLTAAFIYRRLIERFPDNPKVDLISYRMATAYYRAGLAGDLTGLPNAIRYYMEFSDKYKDHELAPDSLYWAANAYLKMKNDKRAFTLLTKLLITYPNAEISAYGKRLRDKMKDENPMLTAEDF